jgi:hypothetical protein
LIVHTMQRAIAEIAHLKSSGVPLFPPDFKTERAGTQTAKIVIRDNLRYRRRRPPCDVESSHGRRRGA